MCVKVHIYGVLCLYVCVVFSVVGFENTSHRSVCWLKGNGFSQSREGEDTTNGELADSALTVSVCVRLLLWVFIYVCVCLLKLHKQGSSTEIFLI